MRRFTLSWAAASMTVSGAIFSSHRILDPVYDWDLDHEIYFGQRLVLGELLWTSEWLDRLLVSQAFFALPGAFGSVNLWFGISILSALFFVVVFFLARTPKDPFFGGGEFLPFEKTVAMSFFLLLVGLLPAGIAHVNVVATSLGAVGLIMFQRATLVMTGRRGWIVLLIGPVVACLGISLRPYLALAFVLPWMLVTALWLLRRIKLSVWLRTSFFGALVVWWGLALNFFPYVWARETEVFWDGLVLLGSGFNTPPATLQFFQGLFSLGNIFVAVTLLAAVAQLFVEFRDGSPLSVKGIFSVGALGLAAGISSQHWWPHYAMLFAPMGAVLLPSIGMFLFQRVAKNLGLRGHAWPRVIAKVISVVLVGVSLAWVFTDLRKGDSVAPRALEGEVVASYLETFPGARNSILVPYNMYAHWSLGESRHGYPHAAYTRHTDRGWFGDGESPLLRSRYQFFETTESYCEHLFGSHLQVVFLPQTSDLNLCFEARAPSADGSERVRLELDHGLIAWQRVGTLTQGTLGFSFRDDQAPR